MAGLSLHDEVALVSWHDHDQFVELVLLYFGEFARIAREAGVCMVHTRTMNPRRIVGLGPPFLVILLIFDHSLREV